MEEDQIIKKFYHNLIEKYGDSPRSLDYRSKDGQKIRFDIITQIGIKNNCSILDVGCGFGDYFNYLKNRGINVEYCGIDLTDKIVETARRKNPDACIIHDNILNMSEDKKFDYVVSLGFNGVKTENNWKTLTKGLDKMWKLCNIGIAFNAVSTFATVQDNLIYFTSPTKVIDYIMNNLTSKIIFRHDYMPHDFTLYAYK